MNAALQQVLRSFGSKTMNTANTTPHVSVGRKYAAPQRESGRLLAALLLAASVAALAVATDRLMSTWADEHVLKTWLALWSVVFAGSLLFAGTARRTAHRVMDTLNAWARDRAHKHAAARQAMLIQEREAQRQSR
jgi:hypothetical protein